MSDLSLVIDFPPCFSNVHLNQSTYIQLSVCLFLAIIVYFTLLVIHTINSIDVLNHIAMVEFILCNTSTHTKPTCTYHRVLSSSPQYCSILLQARCLQTTMFRYNPGLQFPLQNPFIYLSFDIPELPIFINTGASFSIAPTATDFTQEIVASSCTSLNQSSGKTKAVGEDPIKWDIEDVLVGTRRLLKTNTCYVPTTTIRLFSPQTFKRNNAKAQLLLNSKGTCLTLEYGTLLQILLNLSFNLPFMLTETAVNRNQKLHRQQSQSTHFTALRFSKSLWFPSTIFNSRDSNFPPHSRVPMVQDSNISITLKGPGTLTRIIMTNLNHNTTHAVH